VASWRRYAESKIIFEMMSRAAFLTNTVPYESPGLVLGELTNLLLSSVIPSAVVLPCAVISGCELPQPLARSLCNWRHGIWLCPLQYALPFTVLLASIFPMLLCTLISIAGSTCQVYYHGDLRPTSNGIPVFFRWVYRFFSVLHNQTKQWVVFPFVAFRRSPWFFCLASDPYFLYHRFFPPT